MPVLNQAYSSEFVAGNESSLSAYSGFAKTIKRPAFSTQIHRQRLAAFLITVTPFRTEFAERGRVDLRHATKQADMSANEEDSMRRREGPASDLTRNRTKRNHAKNRCARLRVQSREAR